MSIRQRILVAAAMIAAVSLILFFVWFLRTPKETMEGTLVWQEQTIKEG